MVSLESSLCPKPLSSRAVADRGQVLYLPSYRLSIRRASQEG